MLIWNAAGRTPWRVDLQIEDLLPATAADAAVARSGHRSPASEALFGKEQVGEGVGRPAQPGIGRFPGRWEIGTEIHAHLLEGGRQYYQAKEPSRLGKDSLREVEVWSTGSRGDRPVAPTNR